MDYLKPQSPIMKSSTGIYPLTTYDQIIMKDGTRFSGENKDVYSKEESDSKFINVNQKDEFATKEQGQKADSSIQSINGLTPDLSGQLNMPIGMTIKLLWTNSDSTKAFSGQTISLNLLDIDAFIVILKCGVTHDYYNSCFCLKNIPNTIIVYSQSDTGVMGSRSCTFSDNQVVFSNGKITNPFGNTRRTDNNWGIPYKIYGVKFNN